MGDLSVKAAAELRAVNVQTIFRWIRQGVRALDGQRVYLAARKTGGRWRVRTEDLDAFDARINRGTRRPAGRLSFRQQRERRHDEAMDRCRDAGLVG